MGLIFSSVQPVYDFIWRVTFPSATLILINIYLLPFCEIFKLFCVSFLFLLIFPCDLMAILVLYLDSFSFVSVSIYYNFWFVVSMKFIYDNYVFSSISARSPSNSLYRLRHFYALTFSVFYIIFLHLFVLCNPYLLIVDIYDFTRDCFLILPSSYVSGWFTAFTVYLSLPIDFFLHKFNISGVSSFFP